MKIPISKITGHGGEGSRCSMTGLQILLFNSLNFSLVPSLSLSSFDPVFWNVPLHLFISTHLFISFSTKENFMEKNQTLTVIFVWNTLELPQPHVATIPGQESESGQETQVASSPVSMLAGDCSWVLDGQLCSSPVKWTWSELPLASSWRKQ